MNRQSTKKQQGFTIIEVMIVLVIAAVILLIVFLAVPALQRNSRNTQRKRDAAALLAATTEYVQNDLNGIVPLATGSGTGDSEAPIIALGRPNYYTAATIFMSQAAWGSQLVAVTDDNVRIVYNATCGDAGAAVTRNNSVAVMFSLEGSTPRASQCISS